MHNVNKWPSIGLLHNTIKTINYLAALDPADGGVPFPKAVYRAKVKLHGANCGVQIQTDGIVTQSRETILTPTTDLKGFSKWAHTWDSQFLKLPVGMTLFGEWCGPGVEPGMAVSVLPNKLYAVFAIQMGNTVIYDPVLIVSYLEPLGIPGLYVLPWVENVELTVDYADPNSLQDAATQLNTLVLSVEREDPWVKATFNVSGLGEGVVLYPVSVVGEENPKDLERLAQLMFKVKGEKHRTTRTKDAAQVSVEVVSGIDAFVDLVLTSARLEQGLSATCGGVRDPRLTGKFLQWVVADVQKESVAELESSGLTWPQVQGAIQARARGWFLRKD